MNRFRSHTAVLAVCALVAPVASGQQTTPVIHDPAGGWTGFWNNYRVTNTPPIDLSNTNRLESLIRAGKLYLSLQDAVDLALENNLDIAVQRYGVPEAEMDLLRAKAGGALRGVTQSVTQGATSAASSAGLSLNAFSTGANYAAATTTGVNGLISQLGPTVPTYDPVLTGTLSWGHTTSPQTTSALYGVTALTTNSKIADFALTEGLPTGGQVSLTFNNTFVNLNSPVPALNPFTAGNLQLVVYQPLLQGFGFAVNKRYIHQAKNNLKAQDYVFKQQVMTTVSSVVSLYWDLVSYNEQVHVAEQSLATSQKLYEDNKKQVEIGTLAPISIVQAEAEVANREQDVTVAQTNVFQQETILKDALSRTGVASPTIADVHIVPLDHIRIPDVEPVEPVQDLISEALANRPEIGTSQLNIANTKLSVKGDKSALLPQLSAYSILNNNAQVGIANALGTGSVGQPSSGFVSEPADPFFLGGYGSYLGQIFSRNFPDYTVGLQLNVVLRNRAAQSDYIRDTLNLRQNQLSYQKQVNQIRVDVRNNTIAVQQARARYQAAVKSRILEEQTLDAEQKKYALGASTIYSVIQIQRDLATSQGNEVTAESTYIKARNQLDFSLGRTLRANNIDIDEAYRGKVARAPSQIPVLEDSGAPANGPAALPVSTTPR